MVAMGGGGKEDQYTFTSEPRPVASRKKPKYRENEQQPVDDYYNAPANIMFDKRVIRGNTYAAQILPAAPAQDETGKASTGKATLPRQRASGARTPDAVEGRRHIDVQTDQYLEELTDTVPESDTTTQTDAFMDRPPTPLFIPMKIGVDVETQIEAGDLFDFDFSVEPILEVLVGKTLEQGLMEVMEEEELAAMRAHQEHFEQIRNAELVATQRMEAAEKRKVEEKERRMAQEKERVQREKVVQEKVAAQTFARGYLSGLVGSVFDKLYDVGYFYDPVQKEVETEFMPWLTDAVCANINKASAAQKVVEALVTAALAKRAEAQAAAEARRVQERAEEAARKKAEAEAILAAEAAAAAAADARAHRAMFDMEGVVAADARDAAIAALRGDEEGAEAPRDSAVLAKLIEDGVVTEGAVDEAIAAADAAAAPAGGEGDEAAA